MSGIQYTIGLDIGSKLDLMKAINGQVFPLVGQAVAEIAKATAAQWKRNVFAAKLWSGEKDAYVQSITWKATGDFSAVIEADYKYAADIETGRPARDLKRMLDTSEKVRRTTDGRRFLVIPLRHNTPGNTAHAKDMPASVYSMASVMSKSTVNQTGLREVGQTVRLSPHSGMTPTKGSPFLSHISTKQKAFTEAHLYSWGDRLKKAAMKEAGLDAATRKRYGGMVRMDTSTPGGGGSSTYLTFRIMMDGQSGWIVPAKPGLYLAKKTAEEMQPKAQQALELAMKKTLG